MVKDIMALWRVLNTEMSTATTLKLMNMASLVMSHTGCSYQNAAGVEE
ncbi:hypothetical protein AB64_3303 [Escherichia coli 2-427-07_S1_C3]|nr:hypothetical protein AB64_3303 [Escherichia coli 2-427-07_S1_C3]